MFLGRMFILTSEFGGICSFVDPNCTDFARYSFHHIKSAVYEHFSSSCICFVSFFFLCLLVVLSLLVWRNKRSYNVEVDV